MIASFYDQLSSYYEYIFQDWNASVDRQAGMLDELIREHFGSNVHAILDATIFEFRSWANIVALTRNGEVILVKQYRHGICDVLMEFPGGVVEDGEDPMEGAKRELLEETGYTASRLVQIGQIYPNPALQTNTLYCFIALDVEKAAGQSLDPGEDIEVCLVPLDGLVEMAKRGEFPHALMNAVLFSALAYMDRIQ